MTAVTVARLLRQAGYRLQGNAKAVEGKQHPDRDAQFRYINAQVPAFQAAGHPVISVDPKKRSRPAASPTAGWSGSLRVTRAR